MTSPDMKIWLALRDYLKSLEALTGKPIEWPNNALTPPPDGYLRVRHIPNSPQRLFYGSTAPHNRVGIVQVMCKARRGQAVVAGVDDTARALRDANIVADYFKQDTVFSYDDVSVRVMRAPRVGEVVIPTGSPYAECSVEIPYQCFA